MKIIIVNGYPRAGKDTFINAASTILAQYYKIVENLSSVSFINDFLEEAGLSKKDALDNGTIGDWRKMVASIKDFCSNYDIPYKIISQKIDRYWRHELCLQQNGRCRQEYEVILFICTREPAEIERYVKDFNTITIFIDRNLTEKELTNDADKNVKKYNYDYTISNNDSLENFYKEIFIWLVKTNLIPINNIVEGTYI